MKHGALWIHEIRRCGPAALAPPALAAAGVIALSVIAHALGSSGSHRIGPGVIRLIAGVLSVVFPMTAGLSAAAAVGRERLLELQLTLPTGYLTTARRRLTVVGLAVTLAATAVIVTLAASGQWQHPARGIAALLVPLGPAGLLIGAAVFAQITLRSTAGASTVVIGVWLFQLMVLDRYLSPWQVNRVTLLVLGLVLVVLALRRVADTERLIGGGRGAAE